jgi:hypothetical protein
MDLNSINDRQLVTKELLYDHIKDIDIYNMYMDGKPVHINKAMLSPLRKESNVSFGFFIKNNEILFNDFTLGGGDCIRFVQLKYKLSFTDALAQIVNDFNLQSHFITANVKKIDIKRTITQDKDEIIKNNVKFRITKRSRRWTIADKKFWTQFGISLEVLKFYNVEPIDYFFVNGKAIKADRIAYAFTERKDGYESYKIYQPYNRDYKWLNNHNDSVWQGWSQLPENSGDLILTKSLKDVMAINNNLNIPSISLQAESVKPKNKIVEELRFRFDNIYLLYDNDYDKSTNWGQKYAKELTEEHGFINLMIPDKYKSKDYSDLIKNHGVKSSINIIGDLIRQTLH